MDLFDVISNDIKEAMKAKDKVKLETLRNVKNSSLKQRQHRAPTTLWRMTLHWNHAETGKTRERFSRHLPRSGPRRLGWSRTGPSGSAWSLSAQTMSNEELEAALKEIIAEVGAAGPQDMGKVMGVATKKLAGKAEGRAISAKVKELLG